MAYDFLIDTNLPFDVDDERVAAVLRRFGMAVEGTTDLPLIGRRIAAHEPDIAYIPSANWHRSLRKGDRHYEGLIIPMSKFTGSTDYPSVPVVAKDDPAAGLKDLEGRASATSTSRAPRATSRQRSCSTMRGSPSTVSSTCIRSRLGRARSTR